MIGSRPLAWQPTFSPTATSRVDEVERLWAAWGKSGSVHARNALVVHYQPLVKSVARKHVGGSKNQDWSRMDDAIANGQLGLIEAIERYDPSRGVRFETYAQRRVLGAMLDAGRVQGDVPRLVTRDARRYTQAEDDLTQKLGRMPVHSEVCSSLGVSEAEGERLRQAAHQMTAAEGDIESKPEPESERHSAEAAQVNEFRTLVVKAASRIEGPARIVFGLYYFKGMRMADISKLLGVSTGTVSKMHTQAVLDVRHHMDDPNI